MTGTGPDRIARTTGPTRLYHPGGWAIPPT